MKISNDGIFHSYAVNLMCQINNDAFVNYLFYPLSLMNLNYYLI